MRKKRGAQKGQGRKCEDDVSSSQIEKLFKFLNETGCPLCNNYSFPSIVGKTPISTKLLISFVPADLPRKMTSFCAINHDPNAIVMFIEKAKFPCTNPHHMRSMAQYKAEKSTINGDLKLCGSQLEDQKTANPLNLVKRTARGGSLWSCPSISHIYILITAPSKNGRFTLRKHASAYYYKALETPELKPPVPCTMIPPLLQHVTATDLLALDADVDIAEMLYIQPPDSPHCNGNIIIYCPSSLSNLIINHQLKC